MAERAVERICRDAGVPDLVDLLAERLSPTDLQTLLLAVYRRRAAAVGPAKLLERYDRNRFVRPAAVDPKALDEFDRSAFAELPPDYERVELSPVGHRWGRSPRSAH